MRANNDGGRGVTLSIGRAAAKTWVLALLAAAAVLLAYARVWHADFIWDDDAHVYANPVIIGPLGLKEIWTSAKANYFPLTMTSFWLQHALWGLSPAPYHVVCVLFHLAGALVLWQLLRRLAVPGAWLGAMLWALHPVQVESAAWISELKNTQSGFFYLLAIWWFVRWVQRDAEPRVSRDYVLSVIAAVLAILSKSSTVMLPVVLGLIGWWLGHRRWRDVRWLVPFLAVSLIASGWTIWEQKVNSMASGPEWDHGLAARLVIAGKVPWFYLGKLLWPEPLIFIYPRWDVNALGPVHWLPLFATIALGAWLWRARTGRAQGVFVALTYFFVSLFPVLGLFDVFFFRYSFVGDHFQYLASMGPLVLLGAGITVAANRLPGLPSRIAAVAAGALLFVLGILTWKQTGIYRNRETLWADTVALNPRAWIARVNLGSEFMTTGRPALAIPQFEAALQLKPDDPLTEANWGAALLQMGNAAAALPHLEASVKRMPSLAEAHNSLGVALRALGRRDEAVVAFETAVRLKPDFGAAQGNLGDALMEVGRPAEALKHFDDALRVARAQRAHFHAGIARALLQLGRSQEAIDAYVAAVRADPGDFQTLSALAKLLLDSGAYAPAAEYGVAALRVRPDAPEVHFNVGTALLLAGRPAEALPFYEQALKFRPDFVDARSNLGNALYQLGRAAEAIPHYESVVQQRPDVAGNHNNLASALMQVGRLADAIVHYRRALELQPDYDDARANLALALQAAGRKDDAIREYEAVLRARPDHKAAQEALHRLRPSKESADAGR